MAAVPSLSGMMIMNNDRDRMVAAIALHVAAVKCRQLGITSLDFLALAEDVFDNSFKYVVERVCDEAQD